MEATLRDVNSTIRTLLATAVVGAGGYGWYALSYAPAQRIEAAEKKLAEARERVDSLRTDLQARDERIGALGEEVATQRAEVERLDASLHLLRIDRRVAELRVLDQRGQQAEVVTTIEFMETDPEGRAIGEPRRFDVAGDRVYVDYLVVKFSDDLVERADVERGTAIALFQRVFGDRENAADGHTLDTPGTRPTAYARGGEPSAFEERFWADFWRLAHDPAELERLGVRAMQGNATYYKVRPGERYRLSLRTSGDFTMAPIEGE